MIGKLLNWLDLIPDYKTSNDNIIALKVHPLGPNVKGHFNEVFFYFHLKIRRPHRQKPLFGHVGAGLSQPHLVVSDLTEANQGLMRL